LTLPRLLPLLLPSYCLAVMLLLLVLLGLAMQQQQQHVYQPCTHWQLVATALPHTPCCPC
jgi:hypothetical protein